MKCGLATRGALRDNAATPPAASRNAVSAAAVPATKYSAIRRSCALATTSRGLITIHDWAFLIGPGLMAPVNALLIGSVMYRSRLLPRWIPTLGLVGAPLLLVSNIAVLFGLWTQISGPAMVLVLPIAIWEFSFGVHMTAKGFRRTSVDEASFAPVNSAIFDGEV